MDVVTAIMFGVMAIVFEQVLVELAHDFYAFLSFSISDGFWKWEFEPEEESNSSVKRT